MMSQPSMNRSWFGIAERERSVNANVMPEQQQADAMWRWPDALAALGLFLATSGAVWGQNARLAVLWDLSYVLDHSYRIALGDMPYRDFPFVYPPLTFLLQAALIKLAGRVYLHHVFYSAAMGGLGTVLAWRILVRLLRDTMPQARGVALFLSAPLVALGIYCIYPHPFYDPDCTLAILISLLLLLNADLRGFPWLQSFLAGAMLVVPVFVKQNTGLAYLGSAALALLMLLAITACRRQTVQGYVWILSGAGVAFAAALLTVHLTSGLGNYVQWTIRFAAARRLPPLQVMLGVYRNALLPWWLAACAAGWVLLRLSQRHKPTLTLLAGAFLLLPFAWPVIYLALDRDASERAERLLALWPLVMVLAFLCGVISARQRQGIHKVLPFILLGTIHGAFLSQQVWGSTYALWPLLMILIADVIAAPIPLLRKQSPQAFVSLTATLGASLLIAGGFYAASHERLSYAKVTDGDLVRSSLPALRGLPVRGYFLPDFEGLVRYADREIPREDGVLLLPGEDPFFYATGRRPRFPVLLFDYTVNPYSAVQIANLCRARGIRWVIVKRDLQLEAEPYEEMQQLLGLLRPDYELLESLDNYDVYRRSTIGVVGSLETTRPLSLEPECELFDHGESVSRKVQQVRCAFMPDSLKKLAFRAGESYR